MGTFQEKVTGPDGLPVTVVVEGLPFRWNSLLLGRVSTLDSSILVCGYSSITVIVLFWRNPPCPPAGLYLTESQRAQVWSLSLSVLICAHLPMGGHVHCTVAERAGIQEFTHSFCSPGSVALVPLPR